MQTPVLGPAADDLRVGDTVWLRHAKAGEPAEHVSSYVLIHGAGNEADPITVDSVVDTYRGEGRVFL